MKQQIQKVKFNVLCDIAQCLKYMKTKLSWVFSLKIIWKVSLNMKASKKIFTESSLYFPELVINWNLICDNVILKE